VSGERVRGNALPWTRRRDSRGDCVVVRFGLKDGKLTEDRLLRRYCRG
jgi:hypothetical protein